jgi:hypothetical protein
LADREDVRPRDDAKVIVDANVAPLVARVGQ